MANFWKGKKLSAEHRLKLSLAKLVNPVRYWLGKERLEMTGSRNFFYGKNQSGENAWHWKGDKAKRKDERNDSAYKQWRIKVLNRDNYQCSDCGEVKKGEMEADHIFSWAKFPKLRYEINNGQTLCADCHLVRTKAQLRGDYKLIYNY